MREDMKESVVEVRVKSSLAISIAAAGLLFWRLPVFAHHSFAAEYDSSKNVEVKGTVTKFEWTNPHAHFYIDVKTPDGKIEFSGGSVAAGIGFLINRERVDPRPCREAMREVTRCGLASA